MKVRKYIYGVANLKGNYNTFGYCFRSRNTAVDSSESRRHVWWILILKGIRTRREQTFTASVLLCVIGGSSIILFIEN
jgi:hypothetical protein